MKAILLIMLSSFAYLLTQADIRNGYQQELQQAEQSLLNLKDLMGKITTADNEDQLYVLKSHYLRVRRTIKVVSAYYQKTEELITQLAITHPVFFRDLNQVRNYHGNVTDVYIRVMPEGQMKHNQFGTTNLKQAENDPHLYQSSYGENTVSIRIRECSSSKKLRLLIHELAHVKYQVPNLAAYIKYYQKAYSEADEKAAFGHLKEDLSNQSVIDEWNTIQEMASSNKRKQKQDPILEADAGRLNAEQ